MRTYLATLFVLCAAACGDDDPRDSLGDQTKAPPAPVTGDHAGATTPDSSDVNAPPDVLARIHGCSKISFAALGNILVSFGIDTTAKDPDSALQLYAQGAFALGVASYAGRVPEVALPTTSTLAKEFDIFAAAAAEIQSHATAAPTAGACAGAGPLLDASGRFMKEGVSCLLGKAATQDHVFFANKTVDDTVAALGPDKAALGQTIAIAALLQAAHTCE